MRIVPLPVDLELAPSESRAKLGPPSTMESRDCDTIEIVRSVVKLPSGEQSRTVRALVWMSAKEHEQIASRCGTFWIEFIGDTFPPVCFPDAEEL